MSPISPRVMRSMRSSLMSCGLLRNRRPSVRKPIAGAAGGIVELVGRELGDDEPVERHVAVEARRSPNRDTCTPSGSCDPPRRRSPWCRRSGPRRASSGPTARRSAARRAAGRPPARRRRRCRVGGERVELLRRRRQAGQIVRQPAQQRPRIGRRRRRQPRLPQACARQSGRSPLAASLRRRSPASGGSTRSRRLERPMIARGRRLVLGVGMRPAASSRGSTAPAAIHCSKSAITASGSLPVRRHLVRLVPQRRKQQAVGRLARLDRRPRVAALAQSASAESSRSAPSGASASPSGTRSNARPARGGCGSRRSRRPRHAAPRRQALRHRPSPTPPRRRPPPRWQPPLVEP